MIILSWMIKTSRPTSDIHESDFHNRYNGATIKLTAQRVLNSDSSLMRKCLNHDGHYDDDDDAKFAENVTENVNPFVCLGCLVIFSL